MWHKTFKLPFTFSNLYKLIIFCNSRKQRAHISSHGLSSSLSTCFCIFCVNFWGPKKHLIMHKPLSLIKCLFKFFTTHLCLFIFFQSFPSGLGLGRFSVYSGLGWGRFSVYSGLGLGRFSVYSGLGLDRFPT
jgi:hypothetical protein